MYINNYSDLQGKITTKINYFEVENNNILDLLLTSQIITSLRARDRINQEKEANIQETKEEK